MYNARSPSGQNENPKFISEDVVMSPVLPPKLSAELDSLWLLDEQREELDDELAKTPIALGAQQSLPFHGNYTKFCYHRVVVRPGKPLGIKDDEVRPRIPPQFPDSPTPNCVLDIFDDSGNCGHFVWDATIHWGKGDKEWGAWRFVDEPIVARVSADPEHPYLPKGDRFVLEPKLTLTNSSDNKYPRNGAPTGAPYPLALDYPPPGVRPQQHIYYDPQPKQLVWVRPDLNLHARFSQQKADESTETGDTWDNLFVNSIPQWYFALVGWNPSKLKNPFYAGIADSGTQQVVKQGAQATHNVPIFAVPAPDSRDYVVETIGQHQKVYLPRGTIIVPPRYLTRIYSCCLHNLN